MNTKNLLRLGFMSLLCAFGSFAWADDDSTSITLPNQDAISSTFASNDDGYYATDSLNFTFSASDTNIDTAIDDSDGSLKYGSVTIGDTEYTVYYKVNSSAGITFNTTEDNTVLTIVFGPTDDVSGSSYIKITDPSGSTNNMYITTQVFTYTCETAGEYTIKKGSGEYHVFYIGLTAPSDENVTEGEGEGEGNDTGDDDENVTGEEQCLYSTDFTEWEEYMDSLDIDTTYIFTTEYSNEALEFYIEDSSLLPNDTSNLAKFGDYLGCMRINELKDGNGCVTTSALKSITKVEVNYGTTAKDRGLWVYSKGDGDDDWDLTYDGSGSTQGSHPVTIDVNKENCQLKFVSAVDDQYVFLIDLAIYGNVSSNEGEGEEGESSLISVNDANYCTFATDNTVNTTGDIEFLYSTNEDKDEMSTSHGSVTISLNGEETELTCCLKLNSHPTITFTTTEEMVLTLVFETDENLNSADHTDRCITLDGETQTITEGNVMQVTIAAGDHSLSRVSGTEHYLYYVGLSSTTGTGISNAIISSNVENGAIYNLAGQRLSKLTKGINIVNGKKILVR
ncbi:MAG: hypothetical protein LUC91_04095 [Prevotella sp.]|nr:hypothetical protein [Prevotella sp.]